MTSLYERQEVPYLHAHPMEQPLNYVQPDPQAAPLDVTLLLKLYALGIPTPELTTPESVHSAARLVMSELPSAVPASEVAGAARCLLQQLVWWQNVTEKLAFLAEAEVGSWSACSCTIPCRGMYHLCPVGQNAIRH